MEERRERISEINRKGKLIGFSFADGGHPQSGIAYWKWAAYLYQKRLFIIEYHPDEQDEDGLVSILKEIDY